MIAELEGRLDAKNAQLNDVYEDRNLLALLVARLAATDWAGTDWHGWLRIDPEDEACEEGAWPAVLIRTPQEQLSWHVPRDLAGLAHLVTHGGPRTVLRGGDQDPWSWDGHSDEEKRERLRRLV